MSRIMTVYEMGHAGILMNDLRDKIDDALLDSPISPGMKILVLDMIVTERKLRELI